MKTVSILFLFLGIIFFSACNSGLNSTAKNNANSTENTIKQLVNIDSATIIDVRTPTEFAEGHIANSINIPLNVISDSLQSLKQYKNIVVVCRSGNRSAKAKTILKENGFDNVYDGKGWNALNTTLKE